MPDKADDKANPKFDEVDLQIIAVRKDNPSATIREIAARTGIPKTTVWERLSKIGGSDWIKDARNECLALLPAAIAVYARSLGVDAERLAAARDMLYGLGVLRKQHDLTHSAPDGGPIRASVVIYIPDNGRDNDNAAGCAAEDSSAARAAGDVPADAS